MDLMKYYAPIIEKYPEYVTQAEMREICGICSKTAYNLERRGEIPYSVEQRHLIRTHKIRLLDILSYLYKKECRQEPDSPYVHAMRDFYNEYLEAYPDLLMVKDVQNITGFSSSAVSNWITRSKLKAIQPGKSYAIPKDFLLDFLVSPYYRSIKNKTPLQREQLAAFETYWQRQGGECDAANL